jgi:hypothetical protein
MAMEGCEQWYIHVKELTILKTHIFLEGRPPLINKSLVQGLCWPLYCHLQSKRENDSYEKLFINVYIWEKILQLGPCILIWWIKDQQMHPNTHVLAYHLTPTGFGASEAPPSGSSVWACWIVAQCHESRTGWGLYIVTICVVRCHWSH